MKPLKQSVLAEVLDIQNGYAFGSKEYTNAGHLVVRIGNVQNGFLSLEDCRYVTGISQNGLKRFELAAGDMLVSLTGNVGRVAVVREEHLPAVLNQRVARLRPKTDDVDSRYLLYFLFSEAFRNQLIEAGHGAAQQNVSTKEIGATEFNYPPLDEQHRIVAILDKAFAAIDRAKEIAEKNLANAKELFESELSLSLTTKNNWCITKLGKEIRLFAGYPFKSKNYSEAASDIKLLRGDNIVQGCLRWDDAARWPAAETAQYEQYWMKSGDVVLAMDRTWVKAGLKFATLKEGDLPCLLVQRTACLRPLPTMDGRYLYYLIGSTSFIEYVKSVQTGSGVPHISGQQILDFEFALPSLVEQLKIVDRLGLLSHYCDQMIVAYARKVALIDDLKNSLLQQAFSGQL